MKPPSNIRVFLRRIQIDIQVGMERRRHNVYFDPEDNLDDIDVMRSYMVMAIAARNQLRYGDERVFPEQIPTDDVLRKMFESSEPKELPKAAEYQPHEAVLTAKRDVSRVLERYGLATRASA